MSYSVCAVIGRRYVCVGCVFEAVGVDVPEEKEGRSDYPTDRIGIVRVFRNMVKVLRCLTYRQCITSGLSPHFLVVSYLWPRNACAVALAHNVHFQAAALEGKGVLCRGYGHGRHRFLDDVPIHVARFGVRELARDAYHSKSSRTCTRYRLGGAGEAFDGTDEAAVLKAVLRMS